MELSIVSNNPLLTRPISSNRPISSKSSTPVKTNKYEEFLQLLPDLDRVETESRELYSRDILSREDRDREIEIIYDELNSISNNNNNKQSSSNNERLDLKEKYYDRKSFSSTSSNNSDKLPSIQIPHIRTISPINIKNKSSKLESSKSLINLNNNSNLKDKLNSPSFISNGFINATRMSTNLDNVLTIVQPIKTIEPEIISTPVLSNNQSKVKKLVPNDLKNKDTTSNNNETKFEETITNTFKNNILYSSKSVPNINIDNKKMDFSYVFQPTSDETRTFKISKENESIVSDFRKNLIKDLPNMSSKLNYQAQKRHEHNYQINEIESARKNKSKLSPPSTISSNNLNEVKSSNINKPPMIMRAANINPSILDQAFLNALNLAPEIPIIKSGSNVTQLTKEQWDERALDKPKKPSRMFTIESPYQDALAICSTCATTLLVTEVVDVIISQEKKLGLSKTECFEQDVQTDDYSCPSCGLLAVAEKNDAQDIMFEPRQLALLTERKLQQSFDKIALLSSNPVISRHSSEVPRLHRNLAKKSDNLTAYLIDCEGSSSKNLIDRIFESLDNYQRLLDLNKPNSTDPQSNLYSMEILTLLWSFDAMVEHFRNVSPEHCSLLNKMRQSLYSLGDKISFERSHYLESFNSIKKEKDDYKAQLDIANHRLSIVEQEISTRIADAESTVNKNFEIEREGYKRTIDNLKLMNGKMKQLVEAFNVTYKRIHSSLALAPMALNNEDNIQYTGEVRSYYSPDVLLELSIRLQNSNSEQDRLQLKMNEQSRELNELRNQLAATRIERDNERSEVAFMKLNSNDPSSTCASPYIRQNSEKVQELNDLNPANVYMLKSPTSMMRRASNTPANITNPITSASKGHRTSFTFGGLNGSQPNIFGFPPPSNNINSSTPNSIENMSSLPSTPQLESNHHRRLSFEKRPPPLSIILTQPSLETSTIIAPPPPLEIKVSSFQSDIKPNSFMSPIIEEIEVST